MKRVSFVKASLVSLALFTGSVIAAPGNMIIINSTGLSTNAYVHDTASPNVLGPHSAENIPWSAVTNLCHNTVPPMLQSSDPCSFEVYATDDSADPQKIDVGTVTMYLSDGHIANVLNKAVSYGLKIQPLSPGRFELVDGLI